MLISCGRGHMQDIIRTVVRRIEIDDSRIEFIFRVPSPDGPPGSRSPTKTVGSWQHCTGVGRAYLRLGQPQPSLGARFRTLRGNRRCLHPYRHDPHHAPAFSRKHSTRTGPNVADANSLPSDCHSLNQLVGAREQRCWDSKIELFRSFEVITVSYLVGCWTGKSPGLSPLRIRSTYEAARRNMST